MTFETKYFCNVTVSNYPKYEFYEFMRDRNYLFRVFEAITKKIIFISSRKT